MRIGTQAGRTLQEANMQAKRCHRRDNKATLTRSCGHKRDSTCSHSSICSRNSSRSSKPGSFGGCPRASSLWVTPSICKYK